MKLKLIPKLILALTPGLTLFLVMCLVFLGQSLFAFLQPNKEAYERGYKFYTNKKFNQAQIEFEKALEVDKQNPEILNALANLYQKNADFEKAEELYNKAMMLVDEPEEKERLFFNQGNNYFRMEKFNEAIEKYKQALDINDQNYSAKKNLEMALKKLKEQKSQNQENQENQENQDKNEKNQDQNSDNNKQEKNSSDQKDKNQKNDSADNNQDENEQGKKEQEKQSNSDENTQGENKQESKLSLNRAEEILKAFSEKEIKTKGFEFYKEQKSDKKQNKNW